MNLKESMKKYNITLDSKLFNILKKYNDNYGYNITANSFFHGSNYVFKHNGIYRNNKRVNIIDFSKRHFGIFDFSFSHSVIKELNIFNKYTIKIKNAGELKVTDKNSDFYKCKISKDLNKIPLKYIVYSDLVEEFLLGYVYKSDIFYNTAYYPTDIVTTILLEKYKNIKVADDKSVKIPINDLSINIRTLPFFYTFGYVYKYKNKYFLTTHKPNNVDTIYEYLCGWTIHKISDNI